MVKYVLVLMIAATFVGIGLVHANWGSSQATNSETSSRTNSTYEGRNDGGYGETGVAGTTQGTTNARISNIPGYGNTTGNTMSNSAYPTNSDYPANSTVNTTY